METQPVAPWFRREILSGLQRLLCLSLEGQPSVEVIEGTALAWQGALWSGRVWIEERDTVRIAEAFLAMMRTCRRWPAPSQFFEALPKVQTTGPKLAYTASEETRKANMGRIGILLRAGSYESGFFTYPGSAG